MAIMIKLVCTKCGKHFERDLSLLVKKNDPQYMNKALCDSCQLLASTEAEDILNSIFGGFNKGQKNDK